ncbi:MAG TPA: 16S rRNA (uracil(1498)-N(3))-methyltransferase [Methylophilaceae bacterium]|nr:16S rRNA (uracil(1498)-N(3))-methyltransferase [Methylophilaceae bacterium]
MSIPRFHCPTLLAPGAVVSLPPNAAIHASKALRLQAGDKAILFNGDCNDYLCELIAFHKGQVTAKIREVRQSTVESPLKITLAQAISSGDRMDFTLQKAVELGVSAIQPIASQRSVVKLSAERAEKRREHWQNVVISACEQSGRAVVPEVAPPLPLANWLGSMGTFPLRLTLSPTASGTLHDLEPPTGSICLLVGCEGGLTEAEIEMASNNGFQPIKLGRRILRTETAPLAALAAMQTLWGDFKI